MECNDPFHGLSGYKFKNYLYALFNIDRSIISGLMAVIDTIDIGEKPFYAALLVISKIYSEESKKDVDEFLSKYFPLIEENSLADIDSSIMNEYKEELEALIEKYGKIN